MHMIIAEFDPTPEGEAELEAQLRLMVASSRQESGTLSYGISRDERGWVVMEAYRDAKAMKTHLASPALKVLLEKAPGLLRSEARVRIIESVEAFGFGEAR